MQKCIRSTLCTMCTTCDPLIVISTVTVKLETERIRFAERGVQAAFGSKNSFRKSRDITLKHAQACCERRNQIKFDKRRWPTEIIRTEPHMCVTGITMARICTYLPADESQTPHLAQLCSVLSTVILFSCRRGVLRCRNIRRVLNRRIRRFRSLITHHECWTFANDRSICASEGVNRNVDKSHRWNETRTGFPVSKRGRYTACKA